MSQKPLPTTLTPEAAEVLKVSERPLPEKKRISGAAQRGLAMAMMGAAMMANPDHGPHLAGRVSRGEPGGDRKPRSVDNRPDRSPGLQAFDIDGVTIWAGTKKAARKLAARMKHNS